MRASFSLPRTGDFSLPRIDLPLPSPLPRTDPSPPPPRHLPLQNTCLRDRGDPRDGPGAGDASGLGLAAAPDDRVVLGAGTAAPRKSDLFCPSTRVSSFWLPLMMMVIVVIVVMMMVLLMTVSVRPLSHFAAATTVGRGRVRPARLDRVGRAAQQPPPEPVAPAAHHRPLLWFQRRTAIRMADGLQIGSEVAAVQLYVQLCTQL